MVANGFRNGLNDAFYLELLLAPGSIPWNVVVVVILACKSW